MTGVSRSAAASTPPVDAPVVALPEPRTPRGSEPLARVAGWSFVLFAAALPVAMAPMSIAGGLCLGLTLAAWLTRSGPDRVRTPIDRPALVALVAMGLATLTAVDRPASATNLTKGLIPFVAGLAAWHTLDPRRGRAVLAALFASGSVCSLIGVGRFLAAGGHYPARAIGLTGWWMTYSLELLLILCLALGVAITTGGRWRLGALATALACSAGLIFSFTRSAWLGLAVALGVLLGVRKPRALALLVPLLVVTTLALPGELGVRLRSAFDPAHEANRERVMMWDAGWRAFREHPWTGVGLQNLTTLLDRYRVPGEIEHPSHVHNSYFQVALASGIVGLAAFLVLVGALLVTVAGGRGLRHGAGPGPGVRLGATAGVIGFMLAACFDHPFGDQPLLFLIFSIAGIAWAARGWREGAPAVAPSGG